MDGAVALVEVPADRHQRRVLTKVVDAELGADRTREGWRSNGIHQLVYRRPTFLLVVGEEACCRVFRKIAFQLSPRLFGKLAVGDHERKRITADQRIRAIEASGVQQGGDQHWIRPCAARIVSPTATRAMYAGVVSGNIAACLNHRFPEPAPRGSWVNLYPESAHADPRLARPCRWHPFSWRGRRGKRQYRGRGGVQHRDDGLPGN